ncbi:hypothetical protein QVD17_06393 [Tagetes erecta]|uniref:Uncharacterized protein n=1 Tax=Tagetes erecta TaxID=13708 RepID=A0AAD8LE41_TARER|nr:hypothetical protein QVD17_06393 [Tagetes erecta]
MCFVANNNEFEEGNKYCFFTAKEGHKSKIVMEHLKGSNGRSCKWDAGFTLTKNQSAWVSCKVSIPDTVTMRYESKRIRLFRLARKTLSNLCIINKNNAAISVKILIPSTPSPKSLIQFLTSFNQNHHLRLHHHLYIFITLSLH